MADERELVRSRIDIVELVSQRVRLKKSGKNWTGLCPFHEDRNPSFSVSPDLGRYKCWSCGAAGDVFTWVMETQGLQFRDALEQLARQAGVELTGGGAQDRTKRQALLDAMSTAQAFFRNELANNTRAMDYCVQRGLDEPTLAKWEVGFAPDIGEALVAELKRKGHRLTDCVEINLLDGNDRIGFQDRFRGRLMFPIRDEQGNLVAYGGRVIGDGTPKYINSSDTPLFSKGRVLYGMNVARDHVRKERSAVLVEGYLDVIACHRSGVETAVATMGTAMADHHVSKLAMWCDEVVLLYDSDEAGQRAAEKATALLTQGGLRVRVALMPKGQDPDTLLREVGPEAVKSAVTKGLPPVDFLLQQIELRHSVESETYWEEAAQALANLSNPLELERYLMPLAVKYPFMRDPDRAVRALRAMVRKAASPQTQETTRASATEQRRGQKVELPPPVEATAFRALLQRETRSLAWDLCTDVEMFVTQPGQRLALVSRRLLEQSKGSESAAELLDLIEDESDRDLMAAVEMSSEAPLDETALLDLKERLGRRREEISIRLATVGSGAPDEVLRSLSARLKELKGEKPLENSEAEGLDTDPDPFV